MILLPTSASKLLAKWQGPFVVKGRKGRVNYEVDMGERQKKCMTFHINMVKPWVEREEMSLWVSEEKVGESCEKERGRRNSYLGRENVNQEKTHVGSRT